MPKRFLTERDGRHLAYAMLREAGSLSWSDTCLFPLAGDDSIPKGRPQNNFVLRYLTALHEVKNEKVEKGFASVLSCFLVGALGDASVVLTAENYEHDEEKYEASQIQVS